MELLRNEELNITENDVLFESDLEILQDWLSNVEQQIQVAKSKITKSKLAYLNGEDVNHEWFGRLKGYKGALNIFRLKLIDRIRILKKEEKDKNILKSDNFNRLLIREIKNEIGDEEFYRIENQLKAKLINK